MFQTGLRLAKRPSAFRRPTFTLVNPPPTGVVTGPLSATFVRPIADGHVNAKATARHRGRTIWIWDCELSDDQDRLCALVRMTIAVRSNPGSG